MLVPNLPLCLCVLSVQCVFICLKLVCCDFRLCIVFHMFVSCFTYLYRFCISVLCFVCLFCVLHVCFVFCTSVLYFACLFCVQLHVRFVFCMSVLCFACLFFMFVLCLYLWAFLFVSFTPPSSRFFGPRPTFRALSHLSTLDSRRSPGGKEETIRSLARAVWVQSIGCDAIFGALF